MSGGPCPRCPSCFDLTKAGPVGYGDDVIALPVDTWRAIRDRAEQVLTAAEIDGIAGATPWLSERGVA